jgi:hypothetical protein
VRRSWFGCVFRFDRVAVDALDFPRGNSCFFRIVHVNPSKMRRPTKTFGHIDSKSIAIRSYVVESKGPDDTCVIAANDNMQIDLTDMFANATLAGDIMAYMTKLQVSSREAIIPATKLLSCGCPSDLVAVCIRLLQRMGAIGGCFVIAEFLGP